MLKPMKIAGGAKVHTKPSTATDSAVPLIKPPPTLVAVRFCVKIIMSSYI